MGQDPKDVTRDTAHDLSALVGELATLMADAHHWLTGPELPFSSIAWSMPTQRSRQRS